MKKGIKTPPAYLYLLQDKENIKNLHKWIKLLTDPFKNKCYAPGTIYIASVLHKETVSMLPDEQKDLVFIAFPSTISGLYQKKDDDLDDEGSIILSIGNRASISFSTDNHSVEKYKEMYLYGEPIIGSYVEIAKLYFEYIKDLMAVPKIK